ncbi:MAG: putative esterase [Naasia sp.]|nr:putative esterase [Naasia sp.]
MHAKWTGGARSCNGRAVTQPLALDPERVLWSVEEGARAASLAERGLLVLLHGRHGDEHDLFPFAAAFREDWVVASLRAPIPAEGQASWFPSRLPVPEQEVAAALAALAQWLERQGAARVAMLGHSQGGATVLEHLVRFPGRLAAAVLVAPLAVSPPPVPPVPAPPVLWQRGDADDAITPELVADLHAWLPFRVTERIYPGLDHRVSDEEIADAAAFLRPFSGAAR